MLKGSCNGGEVDYPALLAGRRPTAFRPTATNCSASAMLSPGATSTQRSTTLCDCAKTCDSVQDRSVTGASGGIGRAIVTELVRMGMHVHALALPDAALDAMQRS